MVKRDKSLDLARGFALLAMAATHTSWLAFHVTTNHIRYTGESFGIYMFFIISAMLLALKNHGEPIGKSLYIKRTKFLWGYLIGFSAIYCLVHKMSPIEYCLGRFDGYWFFLVLWLCMTFSEGVAHLAKYLKRRFPNIKSREALELKLNILLWLFIWAIHAQWDPYIKVFPIADFKLYYPCYVAGKMYASHMDLKRYIFNKWTALGCFLFWVMAWILYPDFWDGVYYMTGMAGAVWVWWLCTKIKGCDIVALIGKEALWVYGLHFYLLLVIGRIVPHILPQGGVMEPWWMQWLVSPILAFIVCFFSVVLSKIIRRFYHSIIDHCK
jgi:hypothetical protein